MEVLRCLPSSLPLMRLLSSVPSDNQIESFGCEWLEIEEPVGRFVPQMKRRRQFLQLDQVNHVLHYDHYRRVIRIADVSLVTAVEELDDLGQRRWWMSIQDPVELQAWVIHFPSLERLVAWVDILRAVAAVTNTTAIIGSVVLAGSCSSVTSKVMASSWNSELVAIIAESTDKRPEDNDKDTLH